MYISGCVRLLRLHLNMAFGMLFILVEHLRRMSLEVSAVSSPAELLYGHYT
jgi:hypothetical protein